VASNDLTMTRYYATLDDIGIRDAVSLLHEEVHYAIVLPNGVQRGTSRQDMLDYLESRPAVQRRHHLLRTAVDGDTEFVYGAVTDNDVVTGRFAAVARIEDGSVRAYQVTFDLELVVVPSGESA
jgi:ketosteroid isomerase-like protein